MANKANNTRRSDLDMIVLYLLIMNRMINLDQDMKFNKELINFRLKLNLNRRKY